jgi:BMFP domain-containing protein YqiC
MAIAARNANDSLEKRVAELEAKLAAKPTDQGDA